MARPRKKKETTKTPEVQDVVENTQDGVAEQAPKQDQANDQAPKTDANKTEVSEPKTEDPKELYLKTMEQAHKATVGVKAKLEKKPVMDTKGDKVVQAAQTALGGKIPESINPIKKPVENQGRASATFLRV